MHVKAISRSRGRSSTAAAAYRSACRIADERTGEVHDYARKGGVERCAVLLPEGAPARFADRSELWNAVEAAERRKDSQVAREVEVSLPVELGPGERWELVRGFAERELVALGMCADVCVHDKGDGNPHAHIMLTTRSVGPDGFGPKERAWNDKALLQLWREAWERDQNAALEAAGSAARVDCRSYAARGVAAAPQRHEGPAVAAVERRARARAEKEGRGYEPVTDARRSNEAVKALNAALAAASRALAAAREALPQAARDLAKRLRASERARRIAMREQDGRRRAWGASWAAARRVSDLSEANARNGAVRASKAPQAAMPRRRM